MNDRRVDAAIVGGGIAGAAAAEVLGRHGVSVAVLDDNLQPGGQYLRGGKRYRESRMDGVRRKGLTLIERLYRSSAQILSRAEVIGIEDGFELLAVLENGELCSVKCRHLLLTTGARERFMPFKGWTLPGVISTGGAQILIKQSGIPPAGEMLVGGAGLFLHAVAGDILKSGGRVPAVLSETPMFRRPPSASVLAASFPKFVQGITSLGRMMISGSTVRWGMRIVEVHREGNLCRVMAVRVDKNGYSIPGSESVYRVSALAAGFGFSANTELAQLAGCELAFDSGWGGWVVKVSDSLETSMPGIYAAGEITAVGGAGKSLIEGRLAGYSILRQLGRIRTDEMGNEIHALTTARRRQMAFARFFNAQYAFPSDYMARWIQSLSDDVILCRCEEVTLGDVRRAVGEGFVTPAGIKKATRCGMGICQGSTCKAILMEVMAALTGRPVSGIPPAAVRMPVKPVLLGNLAGRLQ